MNPLLRQLPQVSKLVERFKGTYPEAIVKEAVRDVISRYRAEILEGARNSLSGLEKDIEEEILRRIKPNLRRVINATGVVINTNLGRAPLAREAVEYIAKIASGYTNLEYSLSKGSRGSRQEHVEEILCRLTGAPSAMVVNNNAGAVYLVLNTLAQGREVIVSRGELVEIGGSFRMPDIMRSSGALLVEVGTTNKTKVQDYVNAISEKTALLMKVHRSNFFIEGFVEEVGVGYLVKIAKDSSLPFYYDIGSGLLLEEERLLGFRTEEPSFAECIKEGVSVVSGSGDKLLGGPQAGIILGEREIVERLKRNPMARALRVDKLTLASLEKTLRIYLEGRPEDIPVIRMLTEKETALKKKALKLKRLLKGFKDLEVGVLRDVSRPGGGSLPSLELPTYCVALKHRKLSTSELSKRLRLSDPPVIGRIKEDMLFLDVRTVFDSELKLIKVSLEKALGLT